MKQELISVIIPVYNVEKYLRRCLYSVLAQTYGNLEILLVDDGSADGSGKICDEALEGDKRIRVWHTKNRGPSRARNLGLENASGEYLLFVDSDDILSEDHIAFLYRQLQEKRADISICDYVSTEEEAFHETDGTQLMVWNGKEALKNLLYQKYFTTGPVCKLFRRAVFTDLRFPEGMLYEDTLTIAMAVGTAERVVYSDAVKYGYYQRKGSTMRSSYRSETYQYVEIAKELMNYVDKEYPDLHEAAVSRFLWANLFVWIKMPADAEDTKKRLIEANIRRYRFAVLRNPEVRWKNRGVILLSYLGQRALQQVYRWQQ